MFFVCGVVSVSVVVRVVNFYLVVLSSPNDDKNEKKICIDRFRHKK